MDKSVADKIEKFFDHYPIKRVKKGQVIIYAGEEPQGIFHLETGDVKQYDITKSGEEIVVNVFKPPAFFPMSWAINKTSNEYFFETASDVTLRLAPAEEVVEFLKINSDVAYDLLGRLYKGTDGLLRRMTYLMKGSGMGRVILELIIESKRFGKQHGKSYRLDLTEKELAARAGLSRESMSRELHKLQKKDLITISHKGIDIKNIDKLEELLARNL